MSTLLGEHIFFPVEMSWSVVTIPQKLYVRKDSHVRAHDDIPKSYPMSEVTTKNCISLKF